MFSSKTIIRDLPNLEDKTLFVVMDGDNNLTCDPKTMDRVMERKQTTELKIIRLLASSISDDESCSSEDERPRPKVKLTIEECLPENSSDDCKTGDLAVRPDFVDPLSELDTEAMQSLKKALASDQAKQILGDDVTAMLDVLSVEDPATFIQNSIRKDHCYTQLSPRLDPKGASFRNQKTDSLGDAAQASGSGVSRKPPPAPQPVTAADSTSPVSSPQEKSSDSDSGERSAAEESDRSSDSDYRNPNSGYRRERKDGQERRRGRRRGSGRGRRRNPVAATLSSRDSPTRDSEATVASTAAISTSQVSTTSVTVSAGPGKRGRPRKVVSIVGRPILTLKSSKSEQPTPPPEPIQIDNAAAKVLSADAIRLGRPVPKSEEERKRDMVRILEKLNVKGRKSLVNPQTEQPKQKQSQQPSIEIEQQSLQKLKSKNEEVVTEMIATLQDSMEEGEVVGVQKSPDKPVRTYERRNSDIRENKGSGESVKKLVVIEPPANVMGGKYPRRENRKLPSHLADTIGPELIMTPEAVRRKPVISSVNQDEKTKERSQLKQISLLKKREDRPTSTSTSTPIEKNTEPILEEATSSSLVEIASTRPTSDTLTELENMLEEGLEVASVSPERVLESDVAAETTDSSMRTIDCQKKVSESAQSLAEKKKSLKAKVKVEDGASALDTRLSEKKQTRRSRDSLSETAAPLPVAEASNVTLDTDKVIDDSIEVKESTEKRRRSDEVSDLGLDSDIDDALSEASWNSEDDPDKLWCICRKPHNNRFMICCDVCEEWFHGKCVGITKSIGKQMEADGLEWSCPPCTKKKRIEEREKELKLVVKTDRSGETKATVQTKLLFSIKRPETRKCIMCSAPVRENSIYCSDQCIRKHSQRAIAQYNTVKTLPDKAATTVAGTSGGGIRSDISSRRVVVMDPASKKVLTGPSAPTVSNLATWLQQNPSFQVFYKNKSNDAPSSSTGVGSVTVKKATPSQQIQVGKKMVVPIKGIVIGSKFNVDGKSGGSVSSNQMKLTVSPNSKHIKILSRTDPAKTTLQVDPVRRLSVKSPRESVQSPFKSPVTAATAATTAEPDALKPVKKELGPGKRRRKEKLEVLDEYKPIPSSVTSTKMEESKEKSTGNSAATGAGGETAIRESVRKTLGDLLRTRAIDANPNAKVDHIDALAFKIEERLYKLWGNADVKYKQRYRSLLFNIRDPKNETLYKKILESAISPKELVKLTHDQMASKELAKWREKENQHQLEMIKKSELELLTLGQTFIVKSRKGEEVIEKDSKVAAVAAEIDPNTSAQELVSALNSVSSTTPDNEAETENKSISETAFMKMKKKEKERRHEKDRKRKRDRSRSRHSKGKKRSRSRSRDHRHRSRDRKSRSSHHSRDKDRHRNKDKTREKEKDRKEEIKSEVEDSKDVATPQVEESVREPLLSDEADYEPTSTVTIKTPEIMVEDLEEPMEVETEAETESEVVWAGDIAMAEVAKFRGYALPASGDATYFRDDVSDTISVVGRIPPDTVWEYLTRQRKLATKDIVVVQVLPVDSNEQGAFTTLFNYLSKRSRIGVIASTSEHVKDFYIYPYSVERPMPPVLQPINIPRTDQGEHILLGIVVRAKLSSRTGFVPRAKPQPALPVIVPPAAPARPKPLPLPKTPPPPPVSATSKAKLPPLPETPPDEAIPLPSYTPPLPDSSVKHDKHDSKKRKIRVHVAISKNDNAAGADKDADNDSPYEPASSDDDLPPLSKLAKKSNDKYPPVSKDTEQMQKEIEEMNRAIEEQTQQLETLTSTVPFLPVIAPVLQQALLPGLPSAAAAAETLNRALGALQAIAPPPPSAVVTAPSEPPPPLTVPAAVLLPDSMDIPLPPSPPPLSLNLNEVSKEESTVSANNPNTSALLMPEVAQIAIPSNLQEILASIQQPKPGTTSDKIHSESLSDPGQQSNAVPPLSSSDNVAQTLPSATTKSQRKKLDRTAIFDDFVPVKSNAIKFDLKFKSKDVDERVIPEVVDLVDNHEKDNGKQPITSAITVQDQDERLRARPLTCQDRISLPMQSSDLEKAVQGGCGDSDYR